MSQKICLRRLLVVVCLSAEFMVGQAREVRVRPIVEVGIVKDNYYDGETKWTLTNRRGKVVLDGSSASYQRQVRPGRYCFRMTDEWGDGICCGRQGNGSFNVTVSGQKNINGTVVYSGGHFRFSSGSRCFHVDRYGTARRVRPPSTDLCFVPHNRYQFNLCFEMVDPRAYLKSYRLLQTFQNALTMAKQHWESIISQGGGKTLRVQDGFRVHADVYIQVVIQFIDGVGGKLAFAAPGELKRSNNRPSGPIQPFTGFMKFDQDDIAPLINQRNLHHVLIHEIGHILGIGTLFEENHLYSKLHPEQGYKGPKGNYAYRQLLMDSGVALDLNDDSITLPIEQDGGQGMAHGHFDERCLFNEIMTGLMGRTNSFSNLTIAVLDDLGFDVDYTQASDFRIPPDHIPGCLGLLGPTTAAMYSTISTSAANSTTNNTTSDSISISTIFNISTNGTNDPASSFNSATDTTNLPPTDVANATPTNTTDAAPTNTTNTAHSNTTSSSGNNVRRRKRRRSRLLRR